MIRDRAFWPKRFTDKTLIEERSLSDRKLRIPPIRDNLDERAEFIRDLIALANASRERGEPGYLLFGIRDNWDIVGIEGQSVQKNLPPQYDPSNDSQVEYLQRNKIERAFNDIATQYIVPKPPILSYHHGVVKGVRVSYLEICAQSQNETVYEVGKDILNIAKPLRQGDSWIRRGESKYPISEKQKSQIYPWTVVPYISIKQWKDYLVKLEWVSKFPNVEDINGYQVLRSVNGEPLSNEIKTFIQTSSSLLVIKGHAGCGKSVFLQDQARQQAINLLQELENYGQEWYEKFLNPIPIFFSLNSLSMTPGESLGRKILNKLRGQNLLRIPATSEPEKIFEVDGKRWLIFLDAFDEVNLQSQDNVWSAILDLAELYKNVQVILTVRPGGFYRELPQSAKVTEIAPFSKEQVVRYFEVQSIETEVLDEITYFLDTTDPELWEHLQYPLFLRIAANYLSGGGLPEEPLSTVEDSYGQQEVHLEPETIDKFFAEDTTTSSEVDLEEISTLVSKELEIQLELEEEELGIDVPSQADLSVSESEQSPIKIGVLLDRVFQELWKHNEKKQIAGMMRPEETYDNLGKLAAHMGGDEKIRQDRAREYVGDGLYWILDLGILIMRERFRIAFLTTLSRAYFAASFLSVLLKDAPNDLPDDLIDLVKDSREFWDKCLELIRDLLPEEDLSALVLCIDELKGV